MKGTRTYTEAQICEGLKARQRDAFEQLYQNYSGALLGILVRMLRDKGAGEDALQEVFVKVWNNIDKYDSSKSGLFAWMATIARNHALDKIRIKGHHTRWEIQPGQPVENTDTRAELFTDAIGVERLMKTLDEGQKEIIDILYFKGYTHAEAAEELNIPLGTVKSRVRRAINELRKHFE